MTTYENRNILARAWRYDRIIEKAHGRRGYEFIWEMPVSCNPTAIPSARRGEEGMKGELRHMRNGAFYMQLAIVAIFIICAANGGPAKVPLPVFAALGIAFGVLGLLLVVLTARLAEPRIRKVFFVLTGAASAGIAICAILHNLLDRLFIIWFGEGFWEKYGMSDEPVFFILAVLVCPALFVIGSVGSVVLLIKARIATHANVA
jgi:hypothetical protein